MLDRAYALLDVKSFDDAHRTFVGYASTPELDRQGDIVDPAGATFRNPVLLLMHHDPTQPIGTAMLSTTPDGILMHGTIARIDEPGRLKERTDEAWQSIKAGLLRASSIGYRILEGGVERLKSGARKLTAIEVLEVSVLTIPANANATIRLVKSLMAASGPSSSLGVTSARVADGAPNRPVMLQQQTITEQITEWETKRAEKAARIVELTDTAASEGVTLDEDQKKEYDALVKAVDDIDRHLPVLRDREKFAIAAATPVKAAIEHKGAVEPRAAGSVVSVRPAVEKGTAFVRYAMAVAQSRGDTYRALEIAKQWHDQTPEVELMIKAAVAPGTVTDTVWAGPLVPVQVAVNEFLELLRPATILGKIPNLRRIPFNTKVPTQTQGGTYGWVGEQHPKPVSALAFGSATLTVAKAAGIIVITEELARLSTPSAEAIVRADMIAGIAQFLDHQFIDPSIAAVAGVNPASITNGLTPITGTGKPLNDLQALIGALSAANVPLAGVVIIMSETNAFTIALLRNIDGSRMFPDMTAQGGSMDGINVVTSNTANGWVIALQPSAILYADDGGVAIDVSREATLQMDSAPMSPTDATTVFRSLWQENLVGLRAERFVNWQRARTPAVQYITGAAYVPSMSETVAASPARSAK
jgi:HK97 family phage major capsid protein/HK97 family phage prohead protease